MVDKPKEPFIRAEDRPDLTIDLDEKISNLTVRQLQEVLRQGAEARDNDIPKHQKDWHDSKGRRDEKYVVDAKTRKDNKDHQDLKAPKDTKDTPKDTLDHPSKAVKEFTDRGYMPFDDPYASIEGAAMAPLDELIKRVSGLELAIAELRRSIGKKGD